MPLPIEICVEELDLLEEDERYIRCVALPGGDPGLALDSAGSVRWMPDRPADYGLWVSDDDRLVLLRGEGAGPVTVARAGRSVEAPIGKPVVLLDQDLVLVNGRRLRIHIHGTTEAVYEPEPLTGRALARMARAAATALALGAAVGVGGGAAADPVGQGASTPIEVRARPPRPARRVLVICTITKMVPGKNKGPLMVHAHCSQPLPVGTRGHILDPTTGAPILNGLVIVKTVTGSYIVAESKLSKPVKATQVRFHSR